MNFSDYAIIYRNWDDWHNAKSDTESDTNRKTCRKKSPLGSGFVKNAARWT
jgi:hypothetical protein